MNHNIDKYSIFSSISKTEAPFEILTEINKNRRFKWDQASGQFSFSQEEEAHLQRAVEEMEEMCGKSPDTVAVLLRQYSGETCSEVLTVTDDQPTFTYLYIISLFLLKGHNL